MKLIISDARKLYHVIVKIVYLEMKTNKKLKKKSL